MVVPMTMPSAAAAAAAAAAVGAVGAAEAVANWESRLRRKQRLLSGFIKKKWMLTST